MALFDSQPTMQVQAVRRYRVSCWDLRLRRGTLLVRSELDWDNIVSTWGMCLAIIVVWIMSGQSIQRRVSATFL